MSIKVINAHRSPIKRADLIYWAKCCCPWPINAIKYDYHSGAYLIRTLADNWIYVGTWKDIKEMISDECHTEHKNDK